MSEPLLHFTYILSSVFFISGLKMLSRPKSAVKGNILSSAGMLLAVTSTMLAKRFSGYSEIIAGILAGSVAGILLSLNIKMTRMPQFVALLNGLGGGASLFVGGITLLEKNPQSYLIISATVSGIIGAITLSGSLVAFGKLENIIRENSILFRGQSALKIIFGITIIVFAVLSMSKTYHISYYWIISLASSLLGILLILPVGGADMPVVIALLNSFSGLAAGASGFALKNDILIITGSLVGTSGLILTQSMCASMNKSIFEVLGWRKKEKGFHAENIYEGKIKGVTSLEIANLLENARNVMIVPGYGMAVSHAQYALKELVNHLEKRGTQVYFGIHPVAGRMPGHMNVLLAEAGIPYEKMKDMEEANYLLPQMDVAIVIGANDVVNPLARENGSNPLSGMPIIDVDRAKTVIVIKRSLSPGFAGIPNPLFVANNTLLFFEDGKKAVMEIISSLKEK